MRAATSGPDASGSELRDAVAALVWVRRALDEHEHPSATLVADAVGTLATAPHAAEVLSHPWTRDWIETSVRLIDRRAPDLLPDGQLEAHLDAATNLVAALALGRHPVRVRFDADGVAWLPGTGAVVVGELARCGRSAEVAKCELDADAPPLTWPHLARVVEAPPATAFGADPGFVVDPALGHAPAEEPADAPEPTAPSAPPGATAADLLARWDQEGLPLAAHRAPPPEVAAPTEVALLLDRLGVPVPSGTNELGGPRIRCDASFDHLSLLSVLRPDELAELERAVTGRCDPVSSRLRGHLAYIGRRFPEAASAYAQLLVAMPGDVDLWRDLCWALRHAGLEEQVRVWILHPDAVVPMAESTDWVGAAGADPTDPDALLAAVLDLLEWIADDLRRR